MTRCFARPVPELCMITNTVLDWVYATHGQRLTSWNQPFLSRECLESYALAISEKGTPLRNWFWILRWDCTPDLTSRQKPTGGL